MFRPTRTPADTALDEVALRRSIAAMSWMGAPVEVRVAGLDTEMDRRVAALCWRAIHEGIANAARHAGAAPVSVTLTVEARDVRLTIVNPVGGDTGGLANPDAPLGFGLGLASLTEFSVLARHADGTALLEARPRTGRTNQIRLHLQHLGWPVCGDPLYGLRPATDAPPTLGVNDPPLCLHAWKITLRHPLRNERMEFTAEPPAWASE